MHAGKVLNLRGYKTQAGCQFCLDNIFMDKMSRIAIFRLGPTENRLHNTKVYGTCKRLEFSNIAS